MTPEAIDKWRKNLAKEIVEAELQEGDEPTMRTFRGRKMVSAGMSAAKDVHELVGELKAIRGVLNAFKMGADILEYVTLAENEYEAKLKALLGAEVE